MKRTLRAAAVAVLVFGGLSGIGVRRAWAQPGVPYGPYSMTRGQFNQYAPVYYPRLYNNYGVPYYSRRPRYYPNPMWRFSNRGVGFYNGARVMNRGGFSNGPGPW